MDGKLAREYGEVFGDVAALLEAARKAASRSVNSVMTATYWLVGRRIVEGELQGQTRSEYGEFLVTQLARDLATRFGNGFRRRNLFQMKAFYLAHRDIIQSVSAPVLPPDREILQAARVKTPLLQHNIVQTVSALSSKPPLLLENSGISAPELLTALTGAFPLVFFHRGLRSLFIVDLKLGRFSHADAGQMHLYLNYAREHWVLSGENPPVGLILCTEKDEAVARYALDGLPNPVLATEYRTTLPSEAALVARVLEAQRALSARRGSKARGPRG